MTERREHICRAGLHGLGLFRCKIDKSIWPLDISCESYGILPSSGILGTAKIHQGTNLGANRQRDTKSVG